VTCARRGEVAGVARCAFGWRRSHHVGPPADRTGEDLPVATFETAYVASFDASPDGRTILYGVSPQDTGDLMMIESFR
jgi:hypothetical protein